MQYYPYEFGSEFREPKVVYGAPNGIERFPSQVNHLHVAQNAPHSCHVALTRCTHPQGLTRT